MVVGAAAAAAAAVAPAALVAAAAAAGAAARVMVCPVSRGAAAGLFGRVGRQMTVLVLLREPDAHGASGGRCGRAPCCGHVSLLPWRRRRPAYWLAVPSAVR